MDIVWRKSLRFQVINASNRTLNRNHCIVKYPINVLRCSPLSDNWLAILFLNDNNLINCRYLLQVLTENLWMIIKRSNVVSMIIQDKTKLSMHLSTNILGDIQRELDDASSVLLCGILLAKLSLHCRWLINSEARTYSSQLLEILAYIIPM